MRLSPSLEFGHGFGSFVLAAAIVGNAAHADDAYDAARRQAEAIGQMLVANGDAPGVSMAVGVDGKIVWSGAFGMADLERRAAANEQTLFRIASVSKPITAAAAARLAESGVLDLDAPISQYLPEYPAAGAKITARQLLSHMGGVRGYEDDETKSIQPLQYR